MNGMPITMLGGLGCGTDLSCGCNTMGLGEPVIMTNLRDKFVTTIRPVIFYSKPPGDFFPLVNNEKTMPAGTKIGSINDYKQVSSNEVWLKANLVFPSWFRYDPAALSVRDKQNVELTQKQKEQILWELVKTAPGGASAPVVKDVTEGAIETLETGGQIVRVLSKSLKYILVGGVLVAGYYGYRHYIKGDKRVKIGPITL